MFLGGLHPGDTPFNEHERLREAGMTYVAYPPPDDISVTRYAAMVDTIHPAPSRSRFFSDNNEPVFCGQIPRLLPLNHIAWALDLLMKEYSTKWVLQTHTNGCAKVWASTQEQKATLIKLNEMMLFDICGVWIAETPQQQRDMKAYQITLQDPAVVVDRRLARKGIVLQKANEPNSQDSYRYNNR